MNDPRTSAAPVFGALPDHLVGVDAPVTITSLHGLLEAQRLIYSDLCLIAMPERIARAACMITGARYAGVLRLGVDGEVVQCAQHGLSEREMASLVELVGPMSRGRGSSKARTRELAGAGLRCFPIVVRGERIAELHLPRTAPLLRDDAGDDEASTSDVLRALLTMAGTSLENAMLHSEAERSKDWLHASGEIARGLLADQGADTLVDVVARSLHVADADFAALCLARTDGNLEIAVAAGVGADDYRGFVLDPADSPLADAAAKGESVILSDVTEIQRPGAANPYGYGPVMMAPLADAHGVRGSVVLCRLAERSPFTVRDLDLATIFADQIVLALGMDDARAQGVWLSVLEDRHSIAQDLHDNVMQRLFATGVGLESLAAAELPRDIAVRLGRYIDDLDETIDEIRSRVFGLRDANGRQLERATTRFPYIAKRDPL